MQTKFPEIEITISKPQWFISYGRWAYWQSCDVIWAYKFCRRDLLLRPHTMLHGESIWYATPRYVSCIQYSGIMCHSWSSTAYVVFIGIFQMLYLNNAARLSRFALIHKYVPDLFRPHTRWMKTCMNVLNLSESITKRRRKHIYRVLVTELTLWYHTWLACSRGTEPPKRCVYRISPNMQMTI